uniref:Uncharacterized protein n=1 Tax=Oryza barthii TaxID=65489 RepID=A0A0D3G1X6_9ORYZ
MPSEFVAARKKPPPELLFAAGRKKQQPPPPGMAFVPSEFAAAGVGRKRQPAPPVEIRRVWAHNVEEEFRIIRNAIDHFPYVSMDTEFPGVIHRPTKHPALLTASDRHGVRASALAPLLMSSGLVCSHGAVKWVTFHSAYDFAYLVKLLMGRKLPRSMAEFLNLVRVFFGDEVYDVKHMMRHCGGELYGGLERVAAALQVKRAAGRCHQAASDSLLTWDVFRRMRELYFLKHGVEAYQGVLFGLELDMDMPNNKTSSLPLVAAR